MFENEKNEILKENKSNYYAFNEVKSNLEIKEEQNDIENQKEKVSGDINNDFEIQDEKKINTPVNNMDLPIKKLKSSSFIKSNQEISFSKNKSKILGKNVLFFFEKNNLE